MNIKKRLKEVYLRFVKTKDTPHNIALGFAIGIFYGLFPLAGVIFTLMTAMIFRANKIAAIIGVFVTNTWMSAILALPSVKLGAKIFGLNWQIAWQDIRRYLFMADIKDVINVLSGDVLLPTLVGFLIIALGIAAVGYFVSLFIIIRYRGRGKLDKPYPTA
jgi:uncharacterized protein (DUF2062 family)